ncbi:hypothetical protein BX661DRAFT_179099 [Kickxella alabastrina]|uniref:uncharacterized protein n=1 Tax=Kickxella alabastrina TaxID=61397 RepID=UPI0022209C35|nr:uncharacterized protein BX661DRAFT_179099 [Kickxella alabastrina]KAI7833060.1 hypothetical protein BX661DRAFT_179099 [Kickxella alabastrina]
MSTAESACTKALATIAINTLELAHNVHARLLVKHIVQAKLLAGNTTHTSSICPELESEAAKLLQNCRATISISDNATGHVHSLEFSRVRITGTVVLRQSTDIEGTFLDMVYIDDGTGVVPFTLNLLPNDVHVSEDLLATERVMHQRLLLINKSAQTQLIGQTVEVLGCLRFLPNSTHLNQPCIWVECNQLNVKSDPMSETLAIMETLDVYRHYFPQHPAFTDVVSCLH